MERLLFVSGLFTHNGKHYIHFNRVFPYKEITTVKDVRELEGYISSIIENNPAVSISHFCRMESPE